MTGLAVGLGLETAAEGVQPRQQSQMMLEQGWRRGQSWLFGAVEGMPAPDAA